MLAQIPGTPLLIPVDVPRKTVEEAQVFGSLPPMWLQPGPSRAVAAIQGMNQK